MYLWNEVTPRNLQELLVLPMEGLEHVHSPEIDIHARGVAGPDGAAGGYLYPSLDSRIFDDDLGLLVLSQLHLIIVVLKVIRGVPGPSLLKCIYPPQGKDHVITGVGLGEEPEVEIG